MSDSIIISADGPAHKWEKMNYEDLAVILRKDNVVPVFSSQAGLLSRENLNDSRIRSVVYAEYVNLTFDETLTQWLAVSDIIRKSAEEYGGLFVDVYKEVPHSRQYFLDHVHLSDDGNAAVAHTFFESLTHDLRVDSLFRAKKALASDTK